MLCSACTSAGLRMPARLRSVVQRFGQVFRVGPGEQRKRPLVPRDAVQARVEQLVRARRLDRQAGGDPESAIEHAAVRDDHHRLAFVPAREVAQRPFDALVQPEKRLAATGQRERRLARAPAPIAVGIEALDLLVGAPLVAAVVPFAQPRLDAQREAVRLGDRLGGLARAQQVARVDGGERPRGQPSPGLARLLETLLVERRVELALEAPLAVPGRDAVPNEDEFGLQASLGFSV